MTKRFHADYARIDGTQREAFIRAVDAFRADLDSGGGRFRKGLRVKGVRSASDVYEMTWARDGRATFSYGPSLREGEPHIIWRRIGTHSIFAEP